MLLFGEGAVLLGLAALLQVSPGEARTLIVPDQYPTIQQAVNASAQGDTVLVRPGTYFGTVVLDERGLTLTSEQGAEATVLDGQQSGPVLAFSYAGVTIEGFTIRNAGDNGIRGINSTVTVRDCAIIDNQGAGNDGGGVMFRACIITFVNNRVIGNVAMLDGGGLYLYACQGLIDGCIIADNRASSGGGVIFNVSTFPYLHLRNTVIARNTAMLYGGGVLVNSGARPHLWNATIVGNSAEHSGGGIWLNATSAPYVWLTLVAINAAPVGGGVHGFQPGANPTYYCSDLWGNAGGNFGGYLQNPIGINGNISLDPQFCDADAGDYRVLPSSPCLPENHPGGCGPIGALGACPASALELPASEQMLHLTVSPNPSRASVTIATPARFLPAMAELYDASGRHHGRRLLRSEHEEWVLDTTAPGGVYFLVVQHGAATSTVKVVVVR